MKAMFGMLQWATGSIAMALAIVSLAAMPAQSARADESDPCGCGTQPSGGFGDPAYMEWYTCFMSCNLITECKTQNGDCSSYNTESACTTKPTYCGTLDDGTKCNCGWVVRVAPEVTSCDCK